MSHEAVAAVTALIELGMIAQDDIVKCLKKALSEPETQRTWVGLTDEEILEAWCIHLDEGDEDEIEEWRHVINEAREIEAKLKEKNT